MIVFSALMTTILYRKNKLDVMKVSLLMTAICCAAMWFLKIKIECKNLTNKNYEFCIELIFMILLVIVIKFFNTVFFSGLIGYYSESSNSCQVHRMRVYSYIRAAWDDYCSILYKLHETQIHLEKLPMLFALFSGLYAFLLCFFMPYT